MIIYPLTIPGPPSTPGPSEANLKQFDAVGEFISPFDGSSQQQKNQDQHWELDLVWPEMTWPQFAPLDAFKGALHGKWGSFLWGPPLATAPQGSALGMPVTTGLNASDSNLLTTGGWLPNQSGLLLPADYFQLGGTPPLSFNWPIVEIESMLGYIFIVLLGNLTPAQGATLMAAPVGFAGLTAATWLNGWLYRVTGFGPGPGLIGTTTIISLALAPSGGFGGAVPSTYPFTNDTGSVIPAPALPARLYQYVNPNPLASDGGGNATLDLFPALRESPPTFTPLVLQFPQGQFRLAENRREAPAKKNKTFTFQMKCREAI